MDLFTRKQVLFKCTNLQNIIYGVSGRKEPMLMHGIQRLNGDGRSVMRHAIAHITYTTQALSIYLSISICISQNRD